MKLKTALRVILFWLLCASGLALFSGLFKESTLKFSQHLMLLLAVFFSLCLIPLFVKWEGLRLKDVGVVPDKLTIRKIALGFLLGLLMTLFQPAFVLLLGHYRIEFTDTVPLSTILNFLALYILVAIREEFVFRSYPIFSLHYRFGLWTAQLMIIVIFSIEHMMGGMIWWQAFLGAGTGALLFGLAAIRTHGIAFPTGLHIAWNFGQWFLGFKNEPGILHGIAESGFESMVERNAWIGYFIVMFFAILITWFYKPRMTG